jgi:hypothetical protein
VSIDISPLIPEFRGKLNSLLKVFSLVAIDKEMKQRFGR